MEVTGIEAGSSGEVTVELASAISLEMRIWEDVVPTEASSWEACSLRVFAW